MWHSSWTTTSSTASGGQRIKKQEKHRLFLALQLPYRFFAVVTRNPVGTTPIFPLQKVIFGGSSARARALRASISSSVGGGGREAARSRRRSRWRVIQSPWLSTKA